MLSAWAVRMLMASFFFNDTATTEIYTLSLHDALPIEAELAVHAGERETAYRWADPGQLARTLPRSEEHTSELQSRQYLVCRLLLEKKKKIESNQRVDIKRKKNYKDA